MAGIVENYTAKHVVKGGVLRHFILYEIKVMKCLLVKENPQ
jgi:hypothetical protein